MKKAKPLIFALALLIHLPALGQADKAESKIKAYINDVVQKVEVENNADQKRQILNASFDKLITVFEKVEKMEKFSSEEKAGIIELRNTLAEKKDELNGVNGYQAVPNNQLNNFANFVQQDIEQADPYITISAGLAVVIVLLLLLL